MFAIRYECEGNNITKEGTVVFVADCDWGPTSTYTVDDKDLKVFRTEKAAESFMKKFKGHPWYHTYNGKHKVFKVKKKTKKIHVGWETA